MRPIALVEVGVGGADDLGVTCPGCGAAARADASWCGQCHTAFEAPAGGPRRLVPAASGPTVVPVYSRWRGGPTALGPVGRISWTVGVVLIAGLTVFSQDIFAMGIWFLLVAPLVLRSVWKRARIR